MSDHDPVPHGAIGASERPKRQKEPVMTIDASTAGLAAATLTKYYSGDHNQSAGAPLHTVTTRDREAITMASMVKLKGTNLGGPATEPVQTITAGGGHHGVITTEVVKATPGADLPKLAKNPCRPE